MRAKKISEPLLTVDEVASLLHVSKKTVLRRIKSGQIRAFHDGGLLRIERDAVDAFVAAKTAQNQRFSQAHARVGKTLTA